MLTSPVCGHAVELEMSTDACRKFYEFRGRHTLLRLLPGEVATGRFVALHSAEIGFGRTAASRKQNFTDRFGR